MAEVIRLKVQCHACGNRIEGTARYGEGHYVPEGIPFEFTAVGRLQDAAGKRRVKGEVVCICPNCKVRNKFVI